MPKDIKELTDLTPDDSNANKGTERGIYMVETSLEQLGAGRSIVVDTDGRVIAGNKTLQAAIEKGFDVQVVQSDGKKLVVVQRTDMDLKDKSGRARQLAYADNRSSEVGLAWDAEQVLNDLDSEINLETWFFDWEVDVILGKIVEEFSPEEEWHGMPEYDNPEVKPAKTLLVHFMDLDALQRFSGLIEQTITEKTKYVYFPEKPRTIIGYTEDES